MRRGRPRHDDVLTPREWQVLDLLRQDLTNEQIAARLGISHDTAKFHVSEILTKLGVQSRQEAAAWQGRPKVAFGLAPVAGVLGKLTSISPWKAAGAGAIGVAGIALALLALGVLMSNGGDELGKIAFVRDGNIWVQELPHGTPTQLTDQGAASRPFWSPSGEWLLYAERDWEAESPPGVQLRLMRADGSDDRQLTSNGFSGYWLPDEDERVVYFTSDGATLAVDADGSNQETLFSPFEEDGERVTRFPFVPPFEGQDYQAYFETREPVDPPIRGAPPPTTSIYMANPDGSDATRISSATIDPAADIRLLPVGWSSDGSHLLLAEISDPVDGVPPPIHLLAVEVPGGEPKPLGLDFSLTAQGDEHPSGRLIVAGAAQEGWTDKRIARIAPDASGFEYLSPPEVAAIDPTWSPDGEQVAYAAAPDLGPDAREPALSQRRIWVMASDGSDQRQITSGEGFRDEAPMWSADGDSLLFARLPADDPCYSGAYDLMRYQLDDGSVEVVSAGLPLFGSYYPLEVGEIPQCEHSGSGLTTDFFGDLNLSQVLHWWQPGQP